MGTQDTQKSAIEQRAGQESRDERGRLAMCVRKPVMNGCQAHFSAIAYEQENECSLEPGGMHSRSSPENVCQIHGDGAITQCPESNGQQNVTHKRKGDTYGTDEEIFPGGLERSLMTVEANQR